MALTESERNKLTADQFAQIDRMSETRLGEYLEGTADLRERIIDKWVKWSPEGLRVRVNVASISWGETIVITWSPENDYTATERRTVQDVLTFGDKPKDAIPRILAAGLSLRQRIEVLEQ